MSQSHDAAVDGENGEEEEEEKSAIMQEVDNQRDAYEAAQLAGNLDERNPFGETNSRGLAQAFASGLIGQGFDFAEVAFGCHYHVASVERRNAIEDNNFGVSRQQMVAVSGVLEDLGQ